MPYDATKDPWINTLLNFGRKSRAITPHNANDIEPYPKAIHATSAGNMEVLPVENDDGDTITYTGVLPGFTPPLRVRRVLATGTTCSVAAID